MPATKIWMDSIGYRRKGFLKTNDKENMRNPIISIEFYKDFCSGATHSLAQVIESLFLSVSEEPEKTPAFEKFDRLFLFFTL